MTALGDDEHTNITNTTTINSKIQVRSCKPVQTSFSSKRHTPQNDDFGQGKQPRRQSCTYIPYITDPTRLSGEKVLDVWTSWWVPAEGRTDGFFAKYDGQESRIRSREREK